MHTRRRGVGAGAASNAAGGGATVGVGAVGGGGAMGKRSGDIAELDGARAGVASLAEKLAAIDIRRGPSSGAGASARARADRFV